MRVQAARIFTTALAAALLWGIGCKGKQEIAYKELLDDDPYIRADAARRLGDAMAVDAVDSLIALIADPDEEVRVTAIESLGKIGEKRTISALAEYSDDPLKTVRMAVCQALGKIGDETGIDTLNERLYDQDDTVRMVAAKSLGDIDSERALDVLIETALRDESENIRRHVVVVIGKRHAKRAIPVLEEALATESDIVRANAAQVLGQIADASSTGVLIDALEDPFYKVRSLSAHSLSKIAHSNSEALDSMRRRLEVEDHDLVNVDISWSLAKCGDRSRLKNVRDLLFTGEPEDARAEAAIALGDVGEESDIELLKKALTDKKGLVRKEAYKALQKLKEG